MNLTVHQIRTMARVLEGKGYVKIRRCYRDRTGPTGATNCIAVDAGGKRVVIDHWGRVHPPDAYHTLGEKK